MIRNLRYEFFDRPLNARIVDRKERAINGRNPVYICPAFISICFVTRMLPESVH